MKKIISVTCIKDIVIDINDDMLTPEAFKEFDSFIGFSGYDDSHEGRVKETFEFVARQLFEQDCSHFIEGIGKAESYKDDEDTVVRFSAEYADWEFEHNNY